METQVGSPKYWMSLDQWRRDPEFQRLAEMEFKSSPLSSPEGVGGPARREFLKLMGASLALSSFGCVRRTAQKIIPYANRPLEVVPGVANIYSSSFLDGADGFGLLVTTREGRPIKLEGNPAHPVNQGGMSARAHAHVLELYDPDRATGPQKNVQNKEKTNFDVVALGWETLDKEVGERLKKGGVALLTGPLGSPSSRALLASFVSGVGGQHFVWSPSNLGSLRRGQELCYGASATPRYRVDKADLIVAVDCDFLGTYLSPTEFTRQFASRRTPGDTQNRLVVFESVLSLTGTNADDRKLIRPSQQALVLAGILYELVVEKKRSAYAGDSRLSRILRAYRDQLSASGLDQNFIKSLGEELWEKRGRSLVLTGGSQAQTASAVDSQVLCNLLNSVLDNEGRTVDHRVGYSTHGGSDFDLSKLIEAMNQGRIKTLLIHGVNPGYALAGTDFATALRKVEFAVYAGDRNDETGRLCDVLAPDSHALEKWGDLEAVEGVYSIQQPTIQPLYKTRAFEDSLISWSKASGLGGLKAYESWYEYVRAYWRDNIHSRHRDVAFGRKGFEDFWYELLQIGVFDTSEGLRKSSGAGRSFRTAALDVIQDPVGQVKSDGFELVLYETVGLRDGRMANVPWLQEFPDPVTKICWDNHLSVSFEDAKKLGLKEGTVVRIKVGESSLKVPTHLQPGQTPGVVGLALGYGRSAAGQVADGVGVNAYQLAPLGKSGRIYSGLVVSLEKTSEFLPLACTQDHHSMEGRQIVVEATLAQFKQNPASNIHKHRIFSVWSQHKYSGHKWGMSIDLNACTGCGACVVACQSENNVSVVGKQYVINGREMHWIRIDRYYVGSPEDPAVVHMPLNCQHCDNAPCETVCPVVATNHGPEGTNDMIYNRCVGTRYCANNCPYKVRRFNWFNYVKNIREPQHMALNPEVTVRPRGVMEKCTFCLHRITERKNAARVEGRPGLSRDEVKVACQQSCPTGAIVFGDTNDPESQVSRVFADQRAYSLLEELNAAPAVRYLSKIRNAESLKAGESHHGQKEGHS